MLQCIYIVHSTIYNTNQTVKNRAVRRCYIKYRVPLIILLVMIQFYTVVYCITMNTIIKCKTQKVKSKLAVKVNQCRFISFGSNENRKKTYFEDGRCHLKPFQRSDMVCVGETVLMS